MRRNLPAAITQVHTNAVSASARTDITANLANVVPRICNLPATWRPDAALITQPLLYATTAAIVYAASASVETVKILKNKLPASFANATTFRATGTMGCCAQDRITANAFAANASVILNGTCRDTPPASVAPAMRRASPRTENTLENCAAATESVCAASASATRTTTASTAANSARIVPRVRVNVRS